MRYAIPFTSPAAVGANTDFANIVAASGQGFKLRRLIGGCRVNSGAITNQQLMLGVYRTTARGTQSSTTAPVALQQGGPSTPPTPGVDLTWSVAMTKGSLLYVVTINSSGGFDLPFEGDEGVEVAAGTANGIGLHNLQTALPANHLWSITAVIEA